MRNKQNTNNVRTTEPSSENMCAGGTTFQRRKPLKRETASACHDTPQQREREEKRDADWCHPRPSSGERRDEKARPI